MIFPILKIKFIMIPALKHNIVFSNITATPKRNFVTLFGNFTETKLYSTRNSYWRVLKIGNGLKNQKWRIPEMSVVIKNV